MSTIITHAHSYPIGYMCLDLSPPHDACKKKKEKGIEKNTLILALKVNT